MGGGGCGGGANFGGIGGRAGCLHILIKNVAALTQYCNIYFAFVFTQFAINIINTRTLRFSFLVLHLKLMNHFFVALIFFVI